MLTIHCPRCDTALALDPASITASHGWARCGHCQHVFDAGQLGLPTLDPRERTETSALATRPVDTKTGTDAGQSPGGIDADATPTMAPEPTHFDWAHIDLGLSSTDDEGLSPNAPTSSDALRGEDTSSDAIDPSDEFAPALRHEDPAWLNELPTQATDTQNHEPEWLADEAATPKLERPARADPLFVDTDAQPQSSAPPHEQAGAPIAAFDQASATPRLRRVWPRVLLGMMLVLAFTAQLLYLQRDWLAARWPVLQPWGERMCAHLGCKLQALRDARHLQVSHSAVVRLPNNRFQMDLELRNDGLTRVATPQLELSLQDAQGHTWARRMVTLHIEGAPVHLAAQQRYSAQISWRTGEADAERLEAYQVRLVHPRADETKAHTQP